MFVYRTQALVIQSWIPADMLLKAPANQFACRTPANFLTDTHSSFYRTLNPSKRFLKNPNRFVHRAPTIFFGTTANVLWNLEPQQTSASLSNPTYLNYSRRFLKNPSRCCIQPSHFPVAVWLAGWLIGDPWWSQDPALEKFLVYL